MTVRYVTKHPEGWAVKAPDASRANSVSAKPVGAKRIVNNLGGREVRIPGKDGRRRDSDTVPPGNDLSHRAIKY